MNTSFQKLLIVSWLGAATTCAWAQSQFVTDFNSGVPAGSATTGTAFVDAVGGVGNSGVLKMTINAAGQVGGYVIDDFNSGNAVNTFKLVARVAIGGGTARPADGMSLSFGTDVSSGAGSEEGEGTGLIVAVDTWDNAAPDTAPAFELKYGGAVIAFQSMAGIRELGRAPDGPILTDGGGNPVAIETHGPAPAVPPNGSFVNLVVQLFADNTVSVSWSNVVVFNHLPIPYVPLSGAKFAFSGRTGGATDNHWVDNLAIFVNTPPTPVTIVTEPADDTATEGQRATFTTEVAGTPPYQVQWFKNGVLIPGANELFYTTPPTALADNGALFRAEIRNAETTTPVVTRNAVLTVVGAVFVQSVRVEACDNHTIVVRYNKPVVLFGNANYNLTGGGGQVVNGWSYGADHSIVRVDTEPLTADTPFSLEISGVEGEDGSTLVPDPTVVPFSFGFGRFCADFEDGMLPPGTTSTGTTPPVVGPGAGGVGQVLHITDRVNSQQNHWTVELPSPIMLDRLQAKWKTYLEGIGGADGFSFNVGFDSGAPPFAYIGGVEEEGADNGLSVTVDTFDNGGGEVGVEIRWNGARIGFTQVAGGVTGPPELMRAQFVDSSVDLTPSGFVTFKHDIYTATAQIPGFAGFMVNRYEFGARTGGANENCWIDDLCINAFTPGAPLNLTGPNDLSVPAGDTATFSVSVGDGTPPFSYQWLRGGIPIGGATSPSYSFTTTAADNGAEFSARVANDCGVVTSRVARLTVIVAPVVQNCSSRGNCHAIYLTYNKPVLLDGTYTVLCSNTIPAIPVTIFSENFDSGNGGFTVDTPVAYDGPWVYTPGSVPTVITGARFYPANDAEERDPASYLLEGSATGLGGPWTTIASGALALPATRNNGGNAPLAGLVFEEVSFANASAYIAYRVTFPTLKNAAAANSMQIAEVELLAAGADVTRPGDLIQLVDGVNDGDADAGPPPMGESVDHVIDNVGQKYLHFLDLNSGFAVQPQNSGSWTQAGQGPENSHPNTSLLNSPAINVSQAGVVQLTFAHRYSFEPDAGAVGWDGGQVRISVNGGAFTAVPAGAFSQNGYSGTVRANSSSDLHGQAAFVNTSANFAGGPGSTLSICTLGAFQAGDTIRVQFMAASDSNTQGPSQPNWQIDSLQVAVADSALSQITITGVTYGESSNVVCLAVSPDLVPDTTVYYTTAQDVHDPDGVAIFPNPTQCTLVHGSGYPPFRVLYERFDDVGNGNLAAFLSSAKFVNNRPDVVLRDPTGFFEAPSNVREFYGARVSGYAIAPVEGDYRFWMSSDDQGATYIATDANPANKVQICREPAWGGIRNFTEATPGQPDPQNGRGNPPVNGSAPIRLLAGQKVYLEGLFTEGGGGDNYALAVTVNDPAPPPNGATPIDDDFFMPMRQGPGGVIFSRLCEVFCRIGPSDQTVFVGQSATFNFVPDGTPPYSIQWSKNGAAISGATNTSYSTPPVALADNNAEFTVTFSNAFSSTNCSALLHVRPNPVVVRCFARCESNIIHVVYNRPVQLDGNYEVNGNAIVVNGVSYGASQSEVLVNIEPIAPDTDLTVVISDVHATDGSLLEPNPTTCTFHYGFYRYCVDFNDGQLPPGTISSGTTPPYVGPEGALHLTDRVNGQANFWTVPLNQTVSFPFFTARWKTYIEGVGGADGMSFNAGVNVGTAFTPEDGAATGLSVQVDTFNNGSADAGVEIKWNGGRIGFIPVGPGIDGTGAPAELALARFVDTSVDVSPGGLVTFKYDTYTVTGQIPGYTGLNVNQYVFASRTGGANENTWIDDFCVNNFALSAPIIAAGPNDASVPENTPVSFGVTGVDGIPPISYQWLLNGAPIAGATSPTYSLTATLADNGNRYSVVLANECGTTTSREATLTVFTPPTLLACGSRGNCRAIYITYSEPVLLNGVYSVACSNNASVLVYAQDFNAGDGGFTVDTPIAYDGPWVYNAGTGSWTQAGQGPEDNHPNTSMLNSPAINVTQGGVVQLTFAHRYSFEPDAGTVGWDGGQVRVSVNGGPFTAVPAGAFSQNGYSGTVRAGSTSALQGQTAFVNNSPNFAGGTITSVCTLGSFLGGDSIRVEFIAASDGNTQGPLQPNWEIDSLALSVSGVAPLTVTGIAYAESSNVVCVSLASDLAVSINTYFVTVRDVTDTDGHALVPNPSTCSFVHRVQPLCPADLLVLCSSPTGAVVNFTTTVSDQCNPPVVVTCTPPSGSVFPVGETTVSCVARDNAGNEGACVFRVTVVADTVPPTITCPSNITVRATNAAGTTVDWTLQASDNCPGLTRGCTPMSGSFFPMGTTPVTCTATDVGGNSVSCSFTVTVNPSGPRNQKQDCLDDLIAFRDTVTDREDGKKLDEAIYRVRKSLNPEYWVDDSHLNPKKGNKVFHDEEHAVKKLMDLIKSKKSNIPDATLQAFIDCFKAVDRELAVIAINEAAAAGVKPKKVEKAREELAKGDAYAAEGDCDKAIHRYRYAWEQTARIRVDVMPAPGGGMRLVFYPFDDNQHDVEASSDLVTWTKIGSARANGEGLATFEIPSTNPFQLRFYRVRED